MCVYTCTIICLPKGWNRKVGGREKKKDGVHVCDMPRCVRMTACIRVYEVRISECVCVCVGESSVSEEQL